jgi:hypothetical protein
LSNYESRIPPEYTLRDIKFEDPFGNLIIEYEGVKIRGDANQYDPTYLNYVTYSLLPKINKISQYEWEWENGYPLMHEPSGYTLSFSVDVKSLDDAFDSGFNFGFEEDFKLKLVSYSGNDYLAIDGSPASTINQNVFNPTKGLKISAIEICNSGGFGPRVENYISTYLEVEPTGKRIERTIYPIEFPLFNKNNGIYPLVSSIWIANNDINISNRTKDGSKNLLSVLRQTYPTNYISLNETSLQDSGKLFVKFGHEPVGQMSEITGGAFGCAFDQSVCNMWVEPSGAFNTLNKTPFDSTDHYFTIESVSLKVYAKKAIGSRDFSLDVVGYSDDKILNVTSDIGGFLQNISGDGEIPETSGFLAINDLGISTNSLSEKDQYFENNLTNNAGGDHYLLSQTPVVNSTEFKWYEIPLKIYEDNVVLGKSRNYALSPMFEHLYLDIFPIPSGASIGAMHLLVRYAPQNAINLIVEGGEHIGKIPQYRSEGKIFPSSMGSTDSIINAGSGYAPISKIENIPHGFDSPTTIKSNYSRRWRGMEGTVQGDFDPDMFDFGFNNPLLDFPFLSGYYDFDYDVGKTVVPRVGSLSGYITTSYQDYKYKNLGWRFNSSGIFSQQLPGYSGSYRTTDWTSLNSGLVNFQSHELYGKISDAFNNVVRISGNNSYINFNNVDFSDGFSIFLRFSPDANVSGVNYNLFQSGCLVSKWDSGKPLEFAIAYSGGFLRGLARNSAGNIISVQDTAHYSSYQYPLSIIFTYNDHNSSGLKLYTDNESSPSWQTLRASSIVPFELYSDTSNLVVGYSSGSGIGMNMFVSEIGVSDKGNIVYSDPDLTYKEVTAQKFLDNHRMMWWNPSQSYSNDNYKLWDYVNEDTLTDWAIGDFKYCQFDSAFQQLTKRTGRDLISFNMVHDGSGYLQRTNISIPSSLNPNVAYHSQIENDFLRFNLTDTPDSFYSTFRRITKDLPRGYKFADRALVVESVIDHKSSGNLVWQDGNIGPKLIVSLYTKKKEPYWIPDEKNWGLINRAIHYLEPSSCIMRLDSTFNYNSLIDDTEQWALFPSETRLTELTEKYYSQDIDDMFLQYDIVYPSGSPFTSRLNLHSAHIRLEDAYVEGVNTNDQLNLFSNGGYVLQEKLNLILENYPPSSSGSMNLFATGPIQIKESGLILFMDSWNFASGQSLSLFTIGPSQVSNSGLSLFVDGSGEYTYSSVNLFAFAHGVATSRSGDYYGLSLSTYNIDSPYNIPGNDFLNLSLFANSGDVLGIQNNIPLFVLNDIEIDSNANSGVLNLSAIGSAVLDNRYPSNSINLLVYNNLIKQQLNLTLYGDTSVTATTGSLNMFAANNLTSGGEVYLRWFNENYGYDIDFEDNLIASIPLNDEIRGVDLMSYGSCSSDSPRKAIDRTVITHDTEWLSEVCNDAGIFRASEVYTNLEAGYDSNYYGIRKFSGLIPNSAYRVLFKGITGQTTPIVSPREIEEVEYGSNSIINYSGAKLIGDYPYLSGQLSLNPPSGRNANDRYGSSVCVKNDLMAVGVPYIDIPDDSGYPILNAGSVFLYRREQDIAGQKAKWNLCDRLSLPSGYKKEYVTKVIDSLFCYPNSAFPEFCISGQMWNVGQVGREFGSSVDIAYSGAKEIVVVGAPGASWNKSFESIVTSGIPICMMVVTDKFEYNEKMLASIANTARKWDTLYKYFSAPLPGNVQPVLDIHILVYQLIFNNSERPLITSSSDWFKHKYIERLDDSILENLNGSSYIKNSMVSGFKQMFFEAFPFNQNKLHNNIPPIVGIFRDNSWSTGGNGSAYNSALNEFISFYKNYAYESGVINLKTNLPSSGYINIEDGLSEFWDFASISILDKTLSTGNLITNNALEFITSGVGQEWANESAYEFQILPPSGGRVYIFEKENNSFNLVQEIKSPNDSIIDENNYADYGSRPNDRFGHSVSISENGEVLAIGSPYSIEPCQIYERDESQNTRMLDSIKDWMSYRSVGDISRYDNLLSVSGKLIASQDAYNNLSQSYKFWLRTDNDFWKDRGGLINLYQKIYDFTYSNIPYTGTYQFLPSIFAGTSRLGYSSAVSDDGNYVAFGAPTDSFNEFDDTNVWGEGEDTWASYNNAGAVRIFEARKYYPHNLAVEYTRFGNIDRNSHPSIVASGHYDEMEGVFSLVNVPFRRLKFSELEIPKNAGLAFIITPEIDAASDEIIDNIKSWLELGDRTLVLVGNDPVWEENGKYQKSNNIINKILTKLNSRMKLVPVDDKERALINGASETDVISGLYNVTKPFVPAYAHSTYIPSLNMFASGVADIKIDLSNLNLSNLYLYPSCTEEDEFGGIENPNCVLPLKHFGDLRAEWNASCVRTIGNVSQTIRYKENWPFHFANDNPAKDCDNYPENPYPYINKENQDPRPILAAAEWFQETIVIPEASGVNIEYIPRCVSVTVPAGQFITSKTFDQNHINDIEFSLLEDEQTYLASGLFKSFDRGDFINPEGSGLIQAIGKSIEGPAVFGLRDFYDETIIALDEPLGDSNVILIASCELEKQFSITNSDENIPFYINLVIKDCNNSSNIVQLTGWTGRTGFIENSQLPYIFNSYKQYLISKPTIDAYTDVVWIWSPLNKPNINEVNELKSWLNIGNKKLIIVYDNDQTIANNVNYICEQLNIESRPLYSLAEGKYLHQTLNTEIYNQLLSTSHPSIVGCENGYVFANINKSTKVSEIYIPNADNFKLIPLKAGQSAEKIIYYTQKVQEEYPVNNPLWDINAQGKVDFDVMPGSGYKIFINYRSDDNTESFPLNVYIDNVIADPDFENETSTVYASLGITEFKTNKLGTLEFQVPNDTTSISVNFFVSHSGWINHAESALKTPKILSVSGCLLPINSSSVYSDQSYTEIKCNGYDIVETPWYTPEYIFNSPIQFRAFKSDSAKYCLDHIDKCPGQLIEDGPVIAAEEFENFSSFVAGYQRSRIVLLADSTMIQGQNPHIRNTDSANHDFIRGLYPPSPEENIEELNEFLINSSGSLTRQFSFVQKIVAPGSERSSPEKVSYFTNSDISVQKFGGILGGGSNLICNENLYDPSTVTRPANPLTEEEYNQAIEDFINSSINTAGLYPRFSGIIDGNLHVDAGIGGGIPSLLTTTGKDYLDVTIISGYPGDLFGYSLDIHNNKLIVGSPYNIYASENIGNWTWFEAYNNSSGSPILSENGGAGAVFYYERTGKGKNAISSRLPWEFKQKIRPSSINIGSDNESSSGIVTDMFGFAVSLDADLIAIGAPGHDYETIYDNIYNSGSFIRKEFNLSFDIPQRVKYDLGSYETRVNQFNDESGVFTPNNGAVFIYNNKLTDWQNRSKTWSYVEKINSQGYNARNINDNFGKCVSIDRSRRDDADYTVVAGSPNHKYATSGNHITSTLNNAGAVYTYDIMLRGQDDIIPGSGSWLKANIFGHKDSSINLEIMQNITGSQVEYVASGLLFSNENGDIFIEVSGYDSSSRGLISHRPYIISAIGDIVRGEEENNSLSLFTDGKPLSTSGNINLFVTGPSSSFVYNNMNLYAETSSGSGNQSLSLITNGVSGVFLNNALNITMSGIGKTELPLNLRIRGK